MLFWALLASGQINMRKVDGWQTFATRTSISQLTSPPDLADFSPNFRRSPARARRLRNGRSSCRLHVLF
jgi:hypothetical protein